MNSAVKSIMDKIEAPSLIAELNDAWQSEQKKRIEFREWIDDSKKAEFINGEIVMHSPVKRRHWKTSGFLQSLLSVYVNLKELGEIGVEKVMIGLTRNDYEPDICFFPTEKSEHFTEDQMIFPAPDFVVEILSTRTQKYDKTTKKLDYAKHGVKEYWIIDAKKQIIEQYLLSGRQYDEPNYFSIDDVIKSKAIDGFEIPVKAIFDKKINIETMVSLMKK
jgi:Uma2 family endonuclease